MGLGLQRWAIEEAWKNSPGSSLSLGPLLPGLPWGPTGPQQ